MANALKSPSDSKKAAFSLPAISWAISRNLAALDFGLGASTIFVFFILKSFH